MENCCNQGYTSFWLGSPMLANPHSSIASLATIWPSSRRSPAPHAMPCDQPFRSKAFRCTSSILPACARQMMKSKKLVLNVAGRKLNVPMRFFYWSMPGPVSPKQTAKFSTVCRNVCNVSPSTTRLISQATSRSDMMSRTAPPYPFLHALVRV